MPDYKVQLDVYNGPLDLLLFLIRRDELDIYDIPIAEVTRQYCEYVTCLQQIDPDAAAEFLVMAATLMELKSRMLLPRVPAEEGQVEDLGDPRMELVRQLLSYKKFKDAALELGAAADLHASRWPRSPIKALASSPASYDLDDVQVWDLVAAFNQLMAAIGRDRVTHDVVFDDTPIALHAADLQDRLSREGALPFPAIFAGRSRAEMIGLFLAMLELIRQRRIRVEQPDEAGPLMVVQLSADPITVGIEWEARGLEPLSEGPAEPAPDEERAIEAATAARADDEDDDEGDEPDEVLSRLNAIRTDVEIEASPPAATDEGN
ncbi:MAG: segregation/condensation protein A [Phycisphaerae bacterium]